MDTIEEGLKSADPGPTLGFSAKASEEGRIVDTDEDGREIFGEEVSREIEEGVHKLETLLESTVDKNFDKWEIYVLRNCLSLGKEAESLMGWIRLRGYEVSYRKIFIPQHAWFRLLEYEESDMEVGHDHSG